MSSAALLLGFLRFMNSVVSDSGLVITSTKCVHFFFFFFAEKIV